MNLSRKENIFTRVVVKIKIFHFYHNRVACQAIVLHLCCSCRTHVALVLHFFCTCVACVAILLLVSGTCVLRLDSKIISAVQIKPVPRVLRVSLLQLQRKTIILYYEETVH